MRPKAVIVALLVEITTSLLGAQQPVQFTPIPPGFDFPADEKELLAAVAADDEVRLRVHAWLVFAGLTQPARPCDAQSEAIWETWYSAEEVFRMGAAPEGLREIQRKLEIPRQFITPGPSPQAVGHAGLAFTLFNQELKDHTRSNQLHLKATLNAINNGWTAQTPLQDRRVKDYPAQAMSLKLVWMPVKKEGLTALPIWDEQAPVQNAPSQDERTWKRKILVDPSRDTIPHSETRDLPGFPKSRVVPLKAFYHFVMNASQAASFPPVEFPGISAGDYAVLVAMHYTTKEIPNWVWATFWWHDKPNLGRFAADRPDSSKIQGPWRNYLMDVAYDMDWPMEANGTPNAAFNPWLEARFLNGVNSNCMTCHQRAVWPDAKPEPVFLPVTRGAAPVNAPIFLQTTKLDFLWSLRDNSQPREE